MHSAVGICYGPVSVSPSVTSLRCVEKAEYIVTELRDGGAVQLASD